jgi:hypothetical protein
VAVGRNSGDHPIFPLVDDPGPQLTEIIARVKPANPPAANADDELLRARKVRVTTTEDIQTKRRIGVTKRYAVFSGKDLDRIHDGLVTRSGEALAVDFGNRHRALTKQVRILPVVRP